MNRSIFLSLVIVILGISSGFASSATKHNSAVALHSEDDEILAALPLSESTVIRFSKDSVHLSLGGHSYTFPVEALSSISHLDECRSEMKVNVKAQGKESLPVEGVKVTLRDHITKEYIDEFRISDESGIVSFPELCAGFYDIYLDDLTEVFFPVSLVNIMHGFQDSADASMTENVRLPVSMDYTVQENRGGGFDVFLNWIMDDNDGRSEALFQGYTYYIYLDNKICGATSDLDFCIEDIKPGDYLVTLSTVSGYGNYSTRVYDLNISQSDFQTTGIENIYDTEEYRYFDLNGKSVAAANLVPGIYIRVWGGGKAEKVIIN